MVDFKTSVGITEDLKKILDEKDIRKLSTDNDRAYYAGFMSDKDYAELKSELKDNIPYQEMVDTLYTRAKVIDKGQYDVLSTRRLATDSLTWQVPIISLTAQAFLFAIIFDDTKNSPFERGVAAFLSLMIALASLHLMRKHRYFEERDSERMSHYESVCGYAIIHGKQEEPDGEWLRISSFRIWLLILWGFAIAAAVAIVYNIGVSLWLIPLFFVVIIICACPNYFNEFLKRLFPQF